MIHDKDWLIEAFNKDKYDVDVDKRKDPLPLARDYLDHMMRFHPASEYDEDMGCVLWHRLPVQEPPHVGSTLDEGWFDEPVHILSKGETNAEYYTHFQLIHIPEH